MNRADALGILDAMIQSLSRKAEDYWERSARKNAAKADKARWIACAEWAGKELESLKMARAALAREGAH